MRSLRSSLDIMEDGYVRICTWGSIALCLIFLAGCQQEMAKQPRYEPLTASPFFEDGRSARDLVPGTVARGQLHLEEPLYTGKAKGDEVANLPLPLTHELLARGR